MCVCKKIYIRIRHILRTLIYFIKAFYIRRCTKTQTVKRLSYKKCLILVPHPDDEWIGCSGLLSEKGYDVTLCYMDMAGGDTEYIHSKRYSELMKISKSNDVRLFVADGNRDNKIFKLKKIIQDGEYYYFCVPSYYDWHEEHFDVMDMLRTALSDFDYRDMKILMYQVSVPMCKDMVTNCIGITKYNQEKKWNTFREVYKTQEYIPVERFKCNEHINGAFSNNYAAEVYSCMNYKKWAYNLDRVLMDTKLIADIKHNYADLIKIRKIVNNFNSNEVLDGTTYEKDRNADVL